MLDRAKMVDHYNQVSRLIDSCVCLQKATVRNTSDSFVNRNNYTDSDTLSNLTATLSFATPSNLEHK